ANFRNIVVPVGAVVTMTGSRPLFMKALSVTVNGVLDASGGDGTVSPDIASFATGYVSANSVVTGGVGRMGGGAGGTTSAVTYSAGGSGAVGIDITTGGAASTVDGGRGGVGGQYATTFPNSTPYVGSGGSGG